MVVIPLFSDATNCLLRCRGIHAWFNGVAFGKYASQCDKNAMYSIQTASLKKPTFPSAFSSSSYSDSGGLTGSTCFANGEQRTESVELDENASRTTQLRRRYCRERRPPPNNSLLKRLFCIITTVRFLLTTNDGYARKRNGIATCRNSPSAAKYCLYPQMYPVPPENTSLVPWF